VIPSRRRSRSRSSRPLGPSTCSDCSVFTTKRCPKDRLQASVRIRYVNEERATMNSSNRFFQRPPRKRDPIGDRG